MNISWDFVVWAVRAVTGAASPAAASGSSAGRDTGLGAGLDEVLDAGLDAGLYEGLGATLDAGLVVGQPSCRKKNSYPSAGTVRSHVPGASDVVADKHQAISPPKPGAEEAQINMYLI